MGNTTLDSDVTKPSVTEAGDGPADTTDPKEIATSVSPDKGAAAAEGAGTVNAVVKIGEVAGPADIEDPRFEEYEAVNALGQTVKVRRNVDTGDSELASESNDSEDETA